MEIAFIYIEEYKNFKKQSFCFSQEFLIKTDIDKRTVTIDPNPGYIPDFFDNHRVLNVSAIIGQNGSGKSNILEFIRKAFPTSNGGFSEECLVLIKDVSPKGKDIQYKFFITPQCKINIVNNTDRQIHQEVIQDTRESGLYAPKYYIEVMSDGLFVNYSNIVDLKIPSSHTKLKLESEEETTSTSDYQNISTMSMLSNDHDNYSNNRPEQIEKLDAYKSREISRNIDFITSGLKDLLDFELPESLLVILMTRDEMAVRKNSKNFHWVNEVISQYEKEFASPKKEKKPTFHNFFLRSTFFNLIVWSASLSKDFDIIEKLSEKIKADSFEGFFRALIDEMIRYSQEHSQYSFIGDKAKSCLALIDFNFEFLIKHDYDNRIFLGEENGIALPVTFEGKYPIQHFLELYVRAKGIDDFFSFKWRSLSSGEQSMLTMVSRFYQLSKNLKNDGNEKPMVILLDEPDIYFHPEWQRKLLFQLLEYLPQIFPNRNMQIILTANTPYLVSDLPPTNVIMMRKTNAGLDVNTAYNMNKKTFASNIHTLLSEDFYVSNFVGEFAKNKIEQLVSFLEHPEGKSVFSEQTALQCINFIGEPVIKNRLFDMHKERFGRTGQYLLEERVRLQEQLDAVNAKIKNEKKGNA